MMNSKEEINKKMNQHNYIQLCVLAAERFTVFFCYVRCPFIVA